MSSSPFKCPDYPSHWQVEQYHLKFKWALHLNGRGQGLVWSKHVHSADTPFISVPELCQNLIFEKLLEPVLNYFIGFNF